MPSDTNGTITFAQQDPSAQAPWTSTTLTSFEDITTLLLLDLLHFTTVHSYCRPGQPTGTQRHQVRHHFSDLLGVAIAGDTGLLGEPDLGLLDGHLVEWTTMLQVSAAATRHYRSRHHTINFDAVC